MNNPVEITPPIPAGATRTITMSVPPAVSGTPTTAEALCAATKAAANNSVSWFEATISAGVFNPVAAWYENYGAQVFPLIPTDYKQIGVDGEKASKTGDLSTVRSDCSQFASDLKTEIDYPKTQVPPIPNTTYEAEWQSSLHGLYSNAVACASAAKAKNAATLGSSLTAMLPFFHTYSAVILAVEKAAL
ncbi:MAG: hypothetical protein ACLPUG_09765 [Acidimicrobiales bacterium]|jgi:hypothetical protein